MKNIRTSVLLLCILIAGHTLLRAQNANFCGTDEMVKKSLQEHPELQAERDQLETYTQSYREQGGNQAQSVVYYIPVVFHIIHEYGPENISDAQIYDELNILNQDYRKLNPDISQVMAAFQGVTADAEIEFRLARKDPNGNCTTGIDRIVSPRTYAANDNSKLNPWPRNKYLNVWVVNSIGTSGVAGYAYLPGTAPNANVDGVLILHNYIGSIGTASPTTSRALTHEIGHFLNLQHTWGSTNQPGVSCGDDLVSDTPITKGWTSCNLTSNAVCNVNQPENVENYMEYSYCSKMFTQGQRTRMRAALNSSVAGRYNLWTASNLAATGTDGNYTTICAPLADFLASPTAICAGGNVSFSYYKNGGQATSWSWSFPGGTPSASTDSFPVVTYNTPGTYSVTLVESNGTGNSTKVRTNYISVYSTTAMYNMWQFTEGFENVSSLPNNDWVVNNSGGYSWSLASNASFNGSKSTELQNATSEYGLVDELCSPTIDLTQIPTVQSIKFQVAFAQRTSADNDKLQVYVSTNCGQSWILRYTRTGTALKTVNPTNVSFTPASYTQWRQESVNIQPYAGSTNFRFKFVFTSGGGNNIYIDDINLNGANGVGEFEAQTAMSVFPNPMDGSSAVTFNLFSQAQVSLDLYDVLGRNVSTVFKGQLGAGEQQFVLNKGSLGAGVYLMKLDIGGRVITRRIMIE